MPASERSLPSSPAPGASPEEALKYYKAQYELLEVELAEFQTSSKDLEAELERDIEQAEKRERQLKEQAQKYKYEVDEWKEKHKQAKTEAASAQASLEREIKTLRQENLTLRQRVRDIEVANDDYERKQRTTEVSLEDMESRYSQAVERAIILEEEVRIGEQERESLRIEAQRLKEEHSDFKIEAEVIRKRLEQAEERLAGKTTPMHARPVFSPRSEISPATTDTSGPSFDTPLAKKTNSSSLSDTPTPPSPPSDKPSSQSHPFSTPLATRLGVPTTSTNTTIRQPPLTAREKGHTRGSSISTFQRNQAGPTYRQSLGKVGLPVRSTALPQSSSIIHLRNLRGKMQKLEERVQTAKSRLPAPTNTPPRASPRGAGPVAANKIPASVTMRSRRKNPESTLSGGDSQSEEIFSTPSVSRTRANRNSLSLRPMSPTRTSMAAPPRPSSRASAVSQRTSTSQYHSGHSRPTSRASISGIKSLTNGTSSYTPNASTDRIRPHSSLSNRGGGTGHEGALDEGHEDDTGSSVPSATPRRSMYTKRISDVGSGIPTPGKRLSFGGGNSRMSTMTSRRQSNGISSAEMSFRPPSRQVLDGVQEGRLEHTSNVADLDETF